jgi:hypothetical protein
MRKMKIRENILEWYHHSHVEEYEERLRMINEKWRTLSYNLLEKYNPPDEDITGEKGKFDLTEATGSMISTATFISLPRSPISDEEREKIEIQAEKIRIAKIKAIKDLEKEAAAKHFARTVKDIGIFLYAMCM